MNRLWLTIIPLLAGAAEIHRIEPQASPVVVHEWGTFTSVVDRDGSALNWSTLGPDDLPCFVRRISGPWVKSALSGKIRMETPVLYFYTPRDTTLSVAVDFTNGVLTEWYPDVENGAELRGPAARSAPNHLSWKDVRITPHAAEDFRIESGTSHYYAARQTKSSPLELGNAGALEKEKFLFYRGVGAFDPPINVHVASDGKVTATPTGGPIAKLILFEKRNGAASYRILGPIESATVIEQQDLHGSVPNLLVELEDILTEQGLYRAEARAMVATWQDAWFEDGERVLYIVPDSVVRSELPLKIQPAPSQVARVFVGRVDLITPQVQRDFVDAVRARDHAGVAKYGRLLSTIHFRMRNELNQRSDEEFLREVYGALSRGTNRCPAK